MARALVTDSGHALWKAVFTVPPERLPLPPKQIETLREALVFEHEPFVKRVIFMCTPQHGAHLAESTAGKIGSALIQLPRRFSTMLQTVVSRMPDAITPDMRATLGKGGADAVQALAPDYPVMRVFAALPIASGVTYHSIIGTRGRGTGPEASDGVVSVRSAHLEGAASEALVPCDHHATACLPAMQEVLRILRENLQPEVTPGERNDP